MTAPLGTGTGNAPATRWIATRAEADKRLAEFAPYMGSCYTRYRNTDHGPEGQNVVSALSPYVRRRLLLESDLVSTALATHGLDDAERFVQEVFWRSYFKGWLEHRPQIWDSYVTGVQSDLNVHGP